MFKRKPLWLATATALGVASMGSFLANPAFAQDQDQDVDEELLVEEVVVTGSRIKRTVDTQSQEIITFTAEDMNISGDISVSDALRSSTMNSFGSFRESSGNSAQSNATLSLRGVGASRTLILLNGRRIVGSPSLGGGGTVNLNMIPFSAVDRIEVIADGASAVYGSDAVAGVVNVILKKNYNGMMVQARYGDRSRDDGTEESASVLMGASGERSNITFSLEYDKRDPIFDADRKFTAASYGDYDGDGDIVGYSETVGVSFYGYSIINPNWDPSVPYDPNDRSTWYITPGAGCVDDPSGTGFVGEMRADAVFGPESGFYCGYAFALVSANRAGVERVNSFVSAEYELTDNIDVFADVLLSQVESFGRYAPPAATGPTIPGDPRNDIGATFGYFRWTDIGTRDNTVNDYLTDINLGARGDLFSGDVTWEAGYTFSNYTSASIGTYYLSYAGLAYNIAYGIDDFDAFVSNLKSTTLNDDRMKLQKVYGGLQFDLFEMGGGTASAYVGAEYYKVKYSALVDGQSEACGDPAFGCPGLVGGSAGNSAKGKRDVTAVFAEAIFPVFDWMEIDGALRYDDYSDFGSATTWRLGTIFSIPSIESLKFKASVGTGFRAPDLSDLYGATAFSAEFATDYYGCQLAGISESDCPERQFDTFIGSNPNLDAEDSETWSVGVEWQFLENWMASVNYFNLTLTSPILYTSAQDQLDVDYFSNGGNPQVQRNSLGQVTRIDAGFQNGVTDFSFESMDFALSGGFDTGIGEFGIQANASYYLNYDAEESYGTGDLYNAAGTLGLPDWRANALFTWSLGDLFASANWDYIGKSESRISDEKWDAWDQWNMQVGYTFGKYGTFTVGANNIFDEDPILDDIVGAPVDEYMYPQVGRVIFVRYNIEM
jgi:iron complex outermembrane receptor protein